jgi:AAA15 family ATPase/GTPase
MLIKFSLRNYKTFHEKAELSLIASSYDKDTLPNNVIDVPKFGLRLVKSAVVYGANASGKSKLIEALSDFGQFIRNSSKESTAGDAVPVEPFWLSTVSVEEPTEFEIVFIHKDILYRYGFEATSERVLAEWFYYRNPKDVRTAKETQVFYRDSDGIDANRSFSVGVIKEAIKTNQILENVLLVSFAAKYNNEHARNLLEWFGTLRGLSGLQLSQAYTARRSKDPDFKKRVLGLLQAADLSIVDYAVEETDELPSDMPESLRETLKQQLKEKKAVWTSINTIHKQYNELRLPVDDAVFSMSEDESAGTQKFFALTGPLLDVLDNGYVLFVDELDSKLHPNLVCKIVEMFHSPVLNQKRAQLIFNTHDTNLLASGHFRRDQIWFTEKDRYGAVTLYSLGEFKTDMVKKGDDFERKYLEGRYAGVPHLSYFDQLLHQPTELIHAEQE